jgi:hypothetical protein
MSTLWAYPNKFFQYSEDGAEDVDSPWNENDFIESRVLDKKSLGLVRPLYHIARSPKTDLTNHSYFLRLTGFNFVNLPATLTGIELKLNARRAGRILDHTVQLSLSNNLVGNNLATLTSEPEKTYVGASDLWNTELTVNDITSDFGVVLRFKAHPRWPHRDSIFIDSIQLRLH